MTPRSIIEKSIQWLTIQYLGRLPRLPADPEALADLYMEASARIRSKLENGVKIDEEK